MRHLRWILISCVFVFGCSNVESTLPPTRTIAKLELPKLTVDNASQPTSVSWPKEIVFPADREFQVELPINLLGMPMDFHVMLQIEDHNDVVVQSGAGTFSFPEAGVDSASVSIYLGKVPKGNYKYNVSIFNAKHGVIGSVGELTSK
jgi:hypothetical protein